VPGRLWMAISQSRRRKVGDAIRPRPPAHAVFESWNTLSNRPAERAFDLREDQGLVPKWSHRCSGRCHRPERQGTVAVTSACMIRGLSPPAPDMAEPPAGGGDRRVDATRGQARAVAPALLISAKNPAASEGQVRQDHHAGCSSCTVGPRGRPPSARLRLGLCELYAWHRETEPMTARPQRAPTCSGAFSRLTTGPAAGRLRRLRLTSPIILCSQDIAARTQGE
jgi:hypothetical protein